MELYFKKDKTGKKGTRVGLKIDKGTAATLGSAAALVYSKINRDQDLKDAASKYIIKSVEYNTKAEEATDEDERKEYKKKAEEYEKKAKEISALIRNRKNAINDKDLKESVENTIDNINFAFENNYITEEERDELLEYTNLENYNYPDEIIDELINE